MSMSLDGFIAGPRDDVGNGLGDGGHRLHDWLSDGRAGIGPSGVNGEVFAELMATGAVVVGRRTFGMAGEWNGDHHGAAIFVLTRRAGDASRWPLVTYVDDVADAMARAKAAAGARDALVHGARTAQLALATGVLDELAVHQIPVLLQARAPAAAPRSAAFAAPLSRTAGAGRWAASSARSPPTRRESALLGGVRSTTFAHGGGLIKLSRGEMIGP